jgi:hypothetical protein
MNVVQMLGTGELRNRDSEAEAIANTMSLGKSKLSTAGEAGPGCRHCHFTRDDVSTL